MADVGGIEGGGRVVSGRQEDIPAVRRLVREAATTGMRTLEVNDQPFDKLFGRVTTAIEKTVPTEGGIPGRIVEGFTGMYQWLDVVTTPEKHSFAALGGETAQFVARVAVTGAGTIGTVKLAALGGTVGGPVGLIAGALVGLGTTYLGSQLAGGAVRAGLGFLNRIVGEEGAL